MSELLDDMELSSGELTLLARAILLELEGSGEDGGSDFGAGTVYARAVDSAWEGYAAERGAQRAFEALGTEAGRVVFRGLERSLLSNADREAENAGEPEGYSAGRTGEYGESGGFDSPLLKTGRGNAAARSMYAGADGEKGGRGGASEEPGPGGARLPERLSEIFCRDARRYDGPFDRY